MITWNIQTCLLLLVTSVILVWYVQFLWNRRKLYMHSWKVPGPFGLPIIGSGYLFIGSPSDIMDSLLKIQSKYPSLAKLWCGPMLIYSIQDPEHIGKILTKCLDKDYVYKFITNVIGTGLLTAPVSKWKEHRKILNPTFNQRVIDSFVELFAEQSVVFTKELMKYAGKKNIDLYVLASRCTLDIVCETAMGIKMNIQTTDNDFQKNLDRAMEISIQRMFKIWLYPDFIFKLHPMSKELDKCSEQLHKFTLAVIKRKMEEYERKRVVEESSSIAQTEEGEAVLPAGSSVFFNAISIHRNPKYWPEPLKFDPARFLPEEVAKRAPGTYVPFSLGIRNCIGARYAMMTMKTIFSTVIRRFKISTEYKSIEEILFNANIVLKLKDGPKISLELR